MKDNFSNQAALYSRYRPVYPPELFEYILNHVPEKELAWDCGTGNGQSAGVLCNYFKKVFATDISKKQIDNAIQKNNIIYAVEPAEKTTLINGSVNLVTVSQALHWFDFEKFYEEVRRVSKHNGMIAVWTYGLLRIDPVTDRIIDQYHFETLTKYWDKERAHVDNGYINIPFPFKRIESPAFSIKITWTPEQLEGYLNTWSALQQFVAVNNYNPVPGIIEKIKQNWQNNEPRAVQFPIHLMIGKIF